MNVYGSSFFVGSILLIVPALIRNNFLDKENLLEDQDSEETKQKVGKGFTKK